MGKPTTLTQEELKEVQIKRLEFISLSQGLTQVELEMRDLNSKKDYLVEKILEGSKSENELISKLKEKYGDISIDANSGEITYITK